MLNRSFMAHGRQAKTKDLLFSQKQRLASSAHWHLALARPTAATVLGCLIARFGFGGNGQACCATVQSANKLIEHPDAVLSSLNNHLLEPNRLLLCLSADTRQLSLNEKFQEHIILHQQKNLRIQHTTSAKLLTCLTR